MALTSTRLPVGAIPWNFPGWVAALIHLWVAPEHFEQWWGYGYFFLVAAAAQLLYAPFLVRWPTSEVLEKGPAKPLALYAPPGEVRVRVVRPIAPL